MKVHLEMKIIVFSGDVAPPGRRGVPGQDGDVSVTSFLAPIQDFDDLDGNISNSSSQQFSKVSWYSCSVMIAHEQ